MLVSVMPVLAITIEEYRAALTRARGNVSTVLACVAAAESGEPTPVAEARALEDIGRELPPELRVEWNGEMIDVSNRWLHRRIDSYRAETDLTKKAVNFTEIDELLFAISTKIGLPTGGDSLSKDEEKRKLAEILARPEYQPQKPKAESGLAAWLQRFLEWLDSLFPASSPSAKSTEGYASLARVLQVLLFAVVIGLLLYLAYRFAPRIFPRMRRGPRAKKSPRTILGERIEADASASDLFSEAENLARAGEVRAAIRKGYIALLCELSDKHVISLAGHKTNRDYLREVRSRDPLLGSMRGMTSSFERSWYGSQPAAADDWAEFRENYRKAVSGV